MSTFQVWTERSGYNLGNYGERTIVNITLPTIPSLTGITFSLISGSLPYGIALVNNTITGIPIGITNTVTYSFVIRATNLSNQISDRTFTLTISGVDYPIWQTPAGLLKVNPNGDSFVLNNTDINFQLSAIDSDSSAKRTISYFIQSGDGSLPPGVSLSLSGVISGRVVGFATIESNTGNGYFDTNYFDTAPFDYGITQDNGEAAPPRIIDQYYQFIVSASNGDTISRQQFTIYVVGDSTLTCDCATILCDSTIFTTDCSNLRAIEFLSNSNLGSYRAENYITNVIDVYDPNSLQGLVSYSLNMNTTNWGINIPYSLNQLVVYYDVVYICVIPHVSGLSFNAEYWYTYGLPSGMSLDSSTGKIFGFVGYQSATTKEYIFTIIATKTGYEFNDIITSSETFQMQILGQSSSVITWQTNPNLGTIIADQPSILQVYATSDNPYLSINYQLVSGELPPGLTLLSTGEIVGHVESFAENPPDTDNLTTLDENTTTFDDNTTTEDRTFIFTIAAQDSLRYSQVTRTFTVYVKVNTYTTCNIWFQPMYPIDIRTSFSEFISDYSIFEWSKLYRPNDSNFGIQQTLKMLIMAGLQSTTLDIFTNALVHNSNKKTYRVGSPTVAIANQPGTDNEVYEVIYVPVYDDSEKGNVSAPSQISWFTSSGIQTFYPVSITNIRNNLSQVQVTVGTHTSTAILDESYLPLWMLTSQPTMPAIGYTKAMVLCYCKPGQGSSILSNIQDSGFNFNSLDFVIDRAIVDVVSAGSGYYTDYNQYIKFSNNPENI